MNKKNKNKLRRKAQLEMIGLIVIVIIVIVSILIYTVHKINNPPRDIQKKYMNKEIATNLLIAMTNTEVRECYNNSLSVLISDCAKNFPPYINCYDKISCEVANKTIFHILNRTLIDWDISFNLSIERTGIGFINLGCGSRAKEKVQGFMILPTRDNQVIEITLDICTK